MREIATQGDESSMALSLRSIGKAFGTKPVLKNIDLVLPRGQAVCLFGINGAGKSTLLRIAAGLLRPDTGAVTLDKYDIRVHAEAAKRRLGMISHASMAYPELTVHENLTFAARLYGVPDRAGRIEELLADTELASFRHERAAILSRGLLQRLAIARALLHRPAVLLADEPFTGLDAGASERLAAVFDRFVREGGTLLMTTHDARMGLRCCQRVAVLDGGMLRLDATKTRIDTDLFVGDYLSYARSSR
ncbi:MAG: heme ABC exporter ATP-binding protein CcmA [Planctomycetes bacterium]|nr:heme ABC exporter ATP-binding protein CcmA [Planctomycetota bacterium]